MTDPQSHNDPLIGDDSLAKILKKVYFIMPFGLVALMASSLLTDDLEILVLSPLIGFAAYISFRMVKRNEIERSVVFFLISVTILVTILATIGEGVHDITIIVYSSELVMAGLLLNKWSQTLVAAIIFLSVGWLSFGEKYGFYTREEIELTNLGELFIVLTVLALSTFITMRISDRLKTALYSSKNQVEETRKISQDLNDTLKRKTKLITDTHVQISKSLKLLLDFLKTSEENAPDVLEEIAILEAVHRCTLPGQDESVSLSNFSKSLEEIIPTLTSAMEDSSATISVDQAIGVGLYLLEFAKSNASKNFYLGISADHERKELNLSGENLSLPTSSMAQIMLKQTRASVTGNEQQFSLRFDNK